VTPPEEIPNEAIIPRLVIDLPGWSDPIVTDNSRERPLQYDNDSRTVVYQGVDAWLPLISIITTTGGYGLGVDNRTVEVAGHQALLSPRYGDVQMLGWEEDGETMAMAANGVDEDQLLAAAEGLVRGADGAWGLSSPPPGMGEVYRTGEPFEGTGRNLDVRFTTDDGGDTELYGSTGGAEAFWGSATDILFETDNAESVTVHGVPGLLTELDGGYRVDWLDREGTVAMRIDLCCELSRAEAIDVVDHLVEVDLDEWRSRTGTEPSAPPSTSAIGAASSPPECPTGFEVTDEDGDGVADTCSWSRAASADGCLTRDMDGDGESDDCARIYNGPTD